MGDSKHDGFKIKLFSHKLLPIYGIYTHSYIHTYIHILCSYIYVHAYVPVIIVGVITVLVIIDVGIIVGTELDVIVKLDTVEDSKPARK